MPLRVRILGVDGERQGLDRREMHLHQIIEALQVFRDLALVRAVDQDGEEQDRRNDHAGDQADLADEEE